MKILNRNLFRTALLFVVVALSQSCKKEPAHPTAAPPNQGMYALINDTAWTAITITASLEYNGLGTGKTFTCRGTAGKQIIQLTATQNNIGAGNDFPLGPADGSSSSFGYFIMPIHRDLTEQNVTLGTSAGTSLVITSIDTANRLISGTFKFPQADTAYDAFDNVTAITQNRITNGFFKKVHYVYTQ